MTAPAVHQVDSPEEMRALGRRLAAVLRHGDVVVLSGPLGAGKTTLAQGIGAGLGVRGPVTSPTFVIARVHRPLHAGRPALVHADGYRLGGHAELDDLDLDADLDSSVTVMEWGEGLAERLSPDYLMITIARPGLADAAAGPGPGLAPPPGSGLEADVAQRAGNTGISAVDGDAAEPRLVTVNGHGPRWQAESAASCLTRSAH